MEFYEIKVAYTRQTGEDNPSPVNETYLVEGLTPSDVEKRLMNEIGSFISVECDIKGVRKKKIYDYCESTTKHDYWYDSKVELITIDDNGVEKRRAVTILVNADTIEDAVKVLLSRLDGLDCEIVAVKKSPIVEIYRVV